jgi:hypothetical protein
MPLFPGMAKPKTYSYPYMVQAGPDNLLYGNTLGLSMDAFYPDATFYWIIQPDSVHSCLGQIEDARPHIARIGNRTR